MGLAPVVVRELPSRSGDNGRLREIIIKHLMDRVSESELVVGLSALPPRGIMGMGPSAAYILPKALKDVQFSIVARSDSAEALPSTLLTTTRSARGDGPRPRTLRTVDRPGPL